MKEVYIIQATEINTVIGYKLLSDFTKECMSVTVILENQIMGTL